MIKVTLQKTIDDSYSIDIGTGNVAKLPSYLKKNVPAFRYIIITDSNVAALYGKKILALFAEEKMNVFLISFTPGEERKSRETKAELEDKIIKFGAGRDSAIVAFGGGVVGDVSGFVASTLFRGIPFVQVPTTLLAQVDSSSGGKTAVDHPLGKNLIGAYHQPKHICVDTDFLKTLTQDEYVNGIAEIIKQALIQDEKFFVFLEKEMDKLLKRDEKVLKKTIEWNCKLKASIIEQDERESGPRKILNFGHTIGHAIEVLSNYTLRHGYAVSIGMLAESFIAKHLGWLTDKDIKRIEKLLQRAKLPTELPGAITMKQILEKMKLDKKNKSGSIKYSLINKIGHCEFNVGVEDDAVKEVLSWLN